MQEGLIFLLWEKKNSFCSIILTTVLIVKKWILIFSPGFCLFSPPLPPLPMLSSSLSLPSPLSSSFLPFPCTPVLDHKGSTVPGRVPKGCTVRWKWGHISFNKLCLFLQLLFGKQASCHSRAKTAKWLVLGWAPGPQPQTTVYGISKCRPSAVLQAINISFCNGEMGLWNLPVHPSEPPLGCLFIFHPNCIMAL